MTERTVSDAAVARDTVLAESDWHAREQSHTERVDRFVEPHQQRARRGEAHPVWDFLFTYYSLRPKHLRRWHPGFGTRLAGRSAHRYLDRAGYAATAVGDGGRRRGRHEGLPRHSARHRRVHRRSGARHRAAARPAELLRAARVGDGLPRAGGSTRTGAAAARRGGDRRRRRVDAVAVQPLRCLPVLHRRGGPPQRRARSPAGIRSPTNNLVACTPPWISTSGRSSSVR